MCKKMIMSVACTKQRIKMLLEEWINEEKPEVREPIAFVYRIEESEQCERLLHKQTIIFVQ